MNDSIVIVNAVLEDNIGEFLSIAEIRSKIFHEYCSVMGIETVVKSIDRLKMLGIKIEEKTARTGVKKVPVKIFKLIIKNENECLD